MDEYLGIIKLFAGPYVPHGWLLCDGRLLQIVQNQALYAIMGNRFGGDGRTNFALPDLRKASPLNGLSYMICVEGIFPPRD